MNNEQADQQSIPQGEKPWPLIIMLAMVFSVIVAGFLLVPKTEEQKLWWLSILGTNNYGELMNPPVELEGELFDAYGKLWSNDPETPWKLVLVNQGDCGEACQTMADLATRVHARMNKLAPEVKRGYLPMGASQVAPQQSLGFDLLQAPNINLENLLAGSGTPSLADGPLLFVMNPLEVFFLYYTPEHEGIGMLEDIEHLVKLAN